MKSWMLFGVLVDKAITCNKVSLLYTVKLNSLDLVELEPINQSMFICRQQPKGFSKRQRLLTEPPCKYMKTIHLRYIYVPQQGASSAHTTAPARPDGAMPDANGAHTGQMDQVNSAPTNHTTNDTSQHIKLVVLHSHPSIRISNDSGWK